MGELERGSLDVWTIVGVALAHCRSECNEPDERCRIDMCPHCDKWYLNLHSITLSLTYFLTHRIVHSNYTREDQLFHGRGP